MEEIETYDAAFVADLIRDFDIAPHKAAQLRYAINRAAAHWRRDEGHEAPWEAVDHAAFGKLHDLLVGVRDALPVLDDKALRQLKDIQDFVEGDHEFSRIVKVWEADGERRLGIRLGDPDDHRPGQVLSLARLVDMIAVTIDAVKFGTYVSLPRRGPKQDLRLERWMWSVQNVWVAATRQPFTRDFTTSNEPLSGAARFCVRLYAVLSPETPASRVNSTMKRVIAASR